MDENTGETTTVFALREGDSPGGYWCQIYRVGANPESVVATVYDPDMGEQILQTLNGKMGEKALTAEEALIALNELRSNIIATQHASWSNCMYPLVAILDAAGMELFDSSAEQMAQHYDCYGGAGGFPGALKAEPSNDAIVTARNRHRENIEMKERMKNG